MLHCVGFAGPSPNMVALKTPRSSVGHIKGIFHTIGFRLPGK